MSNKYIYHMLLIDNAFFYHVIKKLKSTEMQNTSTKDYISGLI